MLNVITRSGVSALRAAASPAIGADERQLLAMVTTSSANGAKGSSVRERM
jgi:hypothetical protein